MDISSIRSRDSIMRCLADSAPLNLDELHSKTMFDTGLAKKNLVPFLTNMINSGLIVRNKNMRYELTDFGHEVGKKNGLEKKSMRSQVISVDQPASKPEKVPVPSSEPVSNPDELSHVEFILSAAQAYIDSAARRSKRPASAIDVLISIRDRAQLIAKGA